MPRFSVEDLTWAQEPLVRLTDSVTGARVDIWPGFGSNCLALRLAPERRPREPVELITPPPSPEDLRAAPARWGTPLLFPWPGRIPGGEYTWRGRTHRLAQLDPSGNAIHGLVKDRPWRVTGRQADETAACVSCTITSADLPSRDRAGFPFDWTLSVTWTLYADRLELRAETENTGTQAMPFGFGAHPYFTVPFGREGSADGMRLKVPARARWDLDALRDLDRTGARPEQVRLRVPLLPEEDLTSPVPLGRAPADGVLTTLDPVSMSGWSVSTLTDAAAGLTLSVEASADFRSVVLFAPAGRGAFCIEPWTCSPNVFNAARYDPHQADLLVLEPGARWCGTIRIRLSG